MMSSYTLATDSWYLHKRYGKLWLYVTARVSFKRKRGFRIKPYKPLHLVINELRLRGETKAIEALRLVQEDMSRPYDPLRTAFLIAVFFSSLEKKDFIS